jgi:anti-anti-sigma factor
MAAMSFEVVSASDGELAISISGELDISNIEQLEPTVEPLLGRNPQRMVIDVSQLRFADSSAIAQWVRWAALCGRLEIRDPSPLLRRVIASMGLISTLHLVP